MPIGSTTAPERMCAPTSEPFSSTTTVRSGLTCFSRIAADRPAGPATDDYHVEFHALAFGQFMQSVIHHSPVGRVRPKPPFYASLLSKRERIVEPRSDRQRPNFCPVLPQNAQDGVPLFQMRAVALYRRLNTSASAAKGQQSWILASKENAHLFSLHRRGSDMASPWPWRARAQTFFCAAAAATVWRPIARRSTLKNAARRIGYGRTSTEDNFVEAVKIGRGG